MRPISTPSSTEVAEAAQPKQLLLLPANAVWAAFASPFGPSLFAFSSLLVSSSMIQRIVGVLAAA
jgi:hypothetical protein